MSLGDSNENVKKAIGLDQQNNNSERTPSSFVHFLAVKHDCDVNCQISRFIDNVQMRRQISLSIPNYPLHKLDLYARANMRRRLSPCRCLAGITVTPGGIRLPRSYPLSLSPFSHWFSKTGPRLEEVSQLNGHINGFHPQSRTFNKIILYIKVLLWRSDLKVRTRQHAQTKKTFGEHFTVGE